MPCTEVVELTRTDGSGVDIITINVQRGYCATPVEPCAEGTIQNIDVTSETACECEPLQAHEGELIDLSVDTRFDFAFDIHMMFTLREWAMTTGEYEWSLPSESEVAAF